MNVKRAFVTVCCLLMAIINSEVGADNGATPAHEPGLANQPVRLGVQMQQMAGIKTVMLEAAVHQTEFSAYGSALNIQPLVNLHYRYRLAEKESGSAKAKYQNSQQNINRLNDLYHHGVASKRSLQGQHLQWQVDKASAEAAESQGKAIIDEAVLAWGKDLAQWILTGDNGPLRNFIAGRQTLLKIILPADKYLADGIRTIYIDSSGDRSKAVEAELIALAPHTDNTIQGESYFFKTSAKAIKPGMRFAVWIPEHDRKQSGVVIPESALIRHMDETYVYLKTGQEIFIRCKIGPFTPSPGGYFVADELKPGDQLVVIGGQLLLSEEFRVQIPDEDKD